MAADDATTIPEDEAGRRMMLQPPIDTRKGTQKLRVDRDVANLIRYLQSLEAGQTLVVLVQVESGRRIDWRPAHFGEGK